MMNAESLISDNVIWSGIVSPEAAASGCGDVKLGLSRGMCLGDWPIFGTLLANVCRARAPRTRIPARQYNKQCETPSLGRTREKKENDPGG